MDLASMTAYRVPEWIVNVYKRLFERDEEAKADLSRVFREVRILVVGKSGSGKSTLIRLMIGDKGPRTIRHGVVGEQDIRKEWRHPELPLIIHDSNGIDTNGRNRMSEIRSFIRERNASASTGFEQRVHAVWYVFSALDNRVMDDADLLKMLDNYNDLPLLFVMTHKDLVAPGKEKKVVELVLSRISDSARRAKLAASMVRLGNDMEWDESTGAIVKENERDENGLKDLSKKTMELMSAELWITWAACQAVDMDAKLYASVKLILKLRGHQGVVNAVLGAVPIVNWAESGIMMSVVLLQLVKIWISSMTLEMVQAVMSFEIQRKLCNMAITTALSDVTISGYMLSQITAVVAAGLIFVGALMFMRMRDPAEQGSVEDHLELCKEFLFSKEGADIGRISSRFKPKFSNLFRGKESREEEIETLISEIVDCFNRRNGPLLN